MVVGILVAVAFALPPALLVTGLLLVGLAMPSARETLVRWGWIAPVTLALVVPASLVLLFILAWRGDGPTSVWAQTGTGLRVTSVAAFALAVLAVAAQWWVMVRSEHGVAPRTSSVAAAVSGAAMLMLFLAIVLGWSYGVA